MAAATDGVVALFPTEAQRMFRVAGIVTAALGCAATLGGTFLVTSGIHLLQTRELGLGAVGLVIGLILVCALLVLPGVTYLAVAWPARRGRAWAIRSAAAIGSLHLLLAMFIAFGLLSQADSEPTAVLIVAAVVAFMIGYLVWLLRCLAAARVLQPQPRGFELVAVMRASEDRFP